MEIPEVRIITTQALAYFPHDRTVYGRSFGSYLGRLDTGSNLPVDRPIETQWMDLIDWQLRQPMTIYKED
jgi:hypothetical protein